jgi:hypothetical protein
MNIYDAEIHDTVQYYSAALHNMIQSIVSISIGVDCVIQLDTDEATGRYHCCYYLISYTEAVVFWAHDFLTQDMLEGCSSCAGLDHLSAPGFTILLLE